MTIWNMITNCPRFWFTCANGTVFVAILAAALVLFPRPVLANMFEVRNVPVDVTAASAAEARDRALLAGQRAAFYRLLTRLTLQRHHDSLPDLDAKTVATYVRDFSVSGEKTSDVRYLARLDVRFKEGDVRTLLEEFTIPFSETMSHPALVIPLLNRGGRPNLWRDPNPWRVAWSNRDLPLLPVPMMLPIGDLEDVAGLSEERAMATDPGVLESMARRYGAGATIVARANIAPTSIVSTGLPYIDLSLTRLDIGIGAETYTVRIDAEAGEAVDRVFNRAVDRAIRLIEENWKAQTLMRFGEGGVLAVNVPIRSLDHWLSIRRGLDRIAVIRHMNLTAISRKEALVDIHFIGTTDQLVRSLAQSGLALQEKAGTWSMRASETPGGTN